MKKEIRLMLDYQCYPIWIYDEHGDFIDNDLVEEVEKDKNISRLLEDLQDTFDSLYLNNKNEFKYVGFANEGDKEDFKKKVQKIYVGLCNLLGDKYTVKNMISISDM
ncbi:hypothetical protein ACTNDG_11045 [Clostridium sp. HCP1S3_B4]|uniref:hypothetical protein n=1 Tax=unclassified Clostridium TaxID=2614128 RepID=UPI003F89B8FE